MQAAKFMLIGFSVALLEEFITQGVLKGNLGGWIIPTFIAFIPFLGIMRFIGTRLDRRFPPERSSLWYYLAAGMIGLSIEWFLIGLTPWSNPSQPVLMMLFQLGMWSFWCGVAISPKVLLDHNKGVARIRRLYKWTLLGGFVLIYFLTFAAREEDRFGLSITSVIFVFLSLNLMYLFYLRRV